jgi:hypothetical protein
MKKTILGFSLLVALLTATSAATPSASADPTLQSASGFGQMLWGPKTRLRRDSA